MGEWTFEAPSLVRRGYDTGQVNAFLNRIEDTLSGDTESPVTARDLVTAKFRRVTPLARGYVCADVDALLSDVAPAIIRANSARTAAFNLVPDPSFGTATIPVIPVIPARRQEPPARNWLGRTVRRLD